jgi:hypothetical protein
VAFNKKMKKKIVVDGSGRTLYLFTYDISAGGKPQCQNVDPSCPEAWPALTGTGRPKTGKDAAGRLTPLGEPDPVGWASVRECHQSPGRVRYGAGGRQSADQMGGE